MISLIAAFQFLTIIPTIIKRPFTSQEMGRAVGWFPMVGLALGGILYVVNALAQKTFSIEITAALTIMAWVFFTRAFHLDGLMDTCDGLFGGFTTERRLEIMRDSRMGAFGVASGILVLLLKYTALISVPAHDLMPALVMATVIGRWTSPLVIVAFPYAREKGMGSAMKENARFPQLILATTIAALIAWFLAQTFGILLMLLSAFFAFLISLYIIRLLSGLTGDNYGTLTEITETLILLAFAVEL
ncbi:MAG: adenosylcobinamide-GDP ribazoletransferase [Anaerolineae bacterium]|jgi:adenosylcobinamide-GDP ribazoletransferase|nr:adenosylcobinamide-GDP ribazoletransferase [Anaerolineae bacterium]MBT3714223.1 adenosylcobinamide-GDP ribazoletransferase [Anaerolineae bacterium]MBT4312346.1 adenosylcobinamide-GDP ribazoletransferase [Anaerolineae bacterium]MBT4457340.1 adenosylcobinamide-GDP ribazoletransferase [Anaerolineae bacterium]MBT4842883.1 adenosylcobinamide-GDP ribazoletransferase [Anaerolineae bacterium]